ncbi:MAG: CTP synthase, partial [Gammaproteobacteria bacterium]|nr:CTP synthase [Gammaproteobacteria bacterium]
QHSVKELRSIGLQPDILVVRSDHEIPQSARDKIALFTNVEPRAVIGLCDADTIYRIPSMLSEQGMDDIVVEKLCLDVPPADLSDWEQVVEAQLNPKHHIKLKMVGKYMELLDAYMSLTEALIHAGIHTHTKVDIQFIDSSELEEKGTAVLEDADAILVPGGFGARGFEGKVKAARYARENKVPYLGICYGLHAAIVDVARNVVGLENADTTENNPDTRYPVIGLVTEWVTEDGETEQRHEGSDLGGTMRMGEQLCHLSCDSITARVYGAKEIKERHRHRYEVNNNFVPQLEEAGIRVAGRSADKSLVEVIEYKDHPWFVASQFHPEFTSSPRDGHPLFRSFVEAALARHSEK